MLAQEKVTEEKGTLCRGAAHFPALLAKPGTMFVAQPEIPVPLAIEFPFPAWATRPGEAGQAPRATLASMISATDPLTVVKTKDDGIPF